MVSFLNGNKQSQERNKDKIESPSAASIEQAQDEIDRLRQQVNEQSERISQEQKQQARLKDLLTIAEGNLDSLQSQKYQAEREALMNETVRELRQVADEFNQLSWQLGLKMNELQDKLNKTEGLQLKTSKRFVFEQIPPELVRRNSFVTTDLLPYIFHRIGDDRFSLGVRGSADPANGDRLAALRKLEK